MDWSAFGEGVAAGFAGGWTVKAVINVRRSTHITQENVDSRKGSVTQRDNIAGGSIAGRDVKGSE